MKKYIVLYRILGCRMTMIVEGEDISEAISRFYEVAEQVYTDPFLAHDEVFELENFKSTYMNRL